jgi:chorismate mutase/prephenate dehydrogenase
MELMLAARHFAQSADLYAGISMSNRRSEPVLAAFQQACDEVAGYVRAGDLAAFRDFFSEVSDFFGPFRDKALSESSYLIDRVVERSEPT